MIKNRKTGIGGIKNEENKKINGYVFSTNHDFCFGSLWQYRN